MYEKPPQFPPIQLTKCRYTRYKRKILSSYSHMLAPFVRSRSIFCCGVKQRGHAEVLNSFRPAFSWQKPSWMSARLAYHALRKSAPVHCRGGVAFNTLVTQFSHVTSNLIIMAYSCSLRTPTAIFKYQNLFFEKLQQLRFSGGFASFAGVL